ncbi:hypothetical protein GALMADRAFT_620803 [Galerina marginata CBS 339.88]|uniref:Uncharacterized protein n=1 Tax=Galerina marginata (strain CBS 339.88) TaxID=685588 RepID=A0A067T3I8_GALM3|nr:hypothetical protein GALMADRAFT_620803 [Galerina marginata CBS 339.88]
MRHCPCRFQLQAGILPTPLFFQQKLHHAKLGPLLKWTICLLLISPSYLASGTLDITSLSQFIVSLSLSLDHTTLGRLPIFVNVKVPAQNSSLPVIPTTPVPKCSLRRILLFHIITSQQEISRHSINSVQYHFIKSNLFATNSNHIQHHILFPTHLFASHKIGQGYIQHYFLLTHVFTTSLLLDFHETSSSRPAPYTNRLLRGPAAQTLTPDHPFSLGVAIPSSTTPTM